MRSSKSRGAAGGIFFGFAEAGHEDRHEESGDAFAVGVAGFVGLALEGEPDDSLGGIIFFHWVIWGFNVLIGLVQLLDRRERLGGDDLVHFLVDAFEDDVPVHLTGLDHMQWRFAPSPATCVQGLRLGLHFKREGVRRHRVGSSARRYSGRRSKSAQGRELGYCGLDFGALFGGEVAVGEQLRPGFSSASELQAIPTSDSMSVKPWA